MTRGASTALPRHTLTRPQASGSISSPASSSACSMRPVDRVGLFVETAGVTALQAFDGVPGALGNLSWPNASFEPGGEGGVAEVVGPPG